MSAKESPQSVVDTPRKRRWGWILIGSVVVLLLVLGLLPTVLSTPPLKRLILAKVNQSISGRTAVGDLSLGWFSGIRIRDLQFQDTSGRTQVTARQIYAKPRLVSLLTGRGSLGRAVIDQPSVTLTVNPDVSDKMITESKDTISAPQSQRRSTKGIPIRSVDVQIHDGTVEVVDPQDRASVFSGIQSRLDIKPVQSRFTLAAAVESQGRSGSISADVTLQQADAKSWSLKGTSGQWTVDVNGLELHSLEALMSLADLDVSLEGEVNGRVQGQIDQGRVTQLAGTVQSDRTALSGPMIQGDRLATERLVLSMDVTQENEEIHMDALSIDSDWLNAQLQGTLPTPSGSEFQVTGDFDLDVARLADQMPKTLSVKQGAQITRGKLSGRIDVSPTRINGEIQLEGLAGRIEQTNVALSQPIEGQFQVNREDDGFQIETLKLASSFAGIDATGTTDQVTFTQWLDLGQMQSEFGQFLDTGPYTMAGRVSSEGVFKQTDNRMDLSGTLLCENVRIADQNDHSVTEARATLAVQAAYDKPQEVILLTSLDAETGFGRLGLNNAEYRVPDKRLSATISAQALNLERLMAYASLTPDNPLVRKQMQIKGTAQSAIQCRMADGRIEVSTENTRINGFELTVPNKPPFRQDYVSLTCRTLLDTQQKSIDVETLELTSPQIKITKGRFSRSVSDQTAMVKASAECEYDLTAVGEMVSPMIPEGLTMAGQRKDTVVFATAYPVSDPNAFFTAATGRAGFGFDQAAYMGLNLGPTDVNAVFDHGVLNIKPFSTVVNQGRFAFAAQTDFHQSPVSMRLPAPTQIARDIHLTKETTQTLFRYVNPLFANLSEVDGKVNVHCDRLVLPLNRNAKQRLEMTATLSMDDVYLRGSALLETILSRLQTRNVNAQRLVVEPTEIVIQDGVVRYDDMPIIVGDNPVNFSGRIGLEDEALDMRVVLPYTKDGRTARVGENRQNRLAVNLKGTINKPELDIDSVFEQLLEIGIRRGLEEIFK